MAFQFLNFIVENLGLNQSSKQKLNNIVTGLETIIVHNFHTSLTKPMPSSNKKCIFILKSNSLMIDDDNHFYDNDNNNHHPYHNTYYDFLSNIV
jgi:hypothetical protein